MGNSTRTRSAANAKESHMLSAISLASVSKENTALRAYGNRIDVVVLSMILHGKCIVFKILQDVAGSEWHPVDDCSLIPHFFLSLFTYSFGL
jgi:hypothetical protein